MPDYLYSVAIKANLFHNSMVDELDFGGLTGGG